MSAPSQLDARPMLERVLASRSFARAEQLRRLLTYVVTATLEGRESSLKETVIGVDVFDLPASFNPKSDPTVRMAMRRLRARLNQYYQREGFDDGMVIVLEPGRYAPRFERRGEHEQRRVSLTVLPFESSQDAAGEGEWGGLVREAVMTELADRSVFRLVGSESASYTHGDLDALAQKLNVEYVLRGACHTDEGKVRVCTELISLETRDSIWLGNYEQVAGDEIWTVQKDVAGDLEKQVSSFFSLPLRAAERVRPNHSETHEAGISRLILQGRYLLHQDNMEAIRKAEACLAKALEKQPSSAMAWAGRSIALTYMTVYYMAPVQKAFRQAKLCADKAVEYDATLSEAFLAQGLLSGLSEFKPARAGEHFERALALNPDDQSARIMDAMIHLVPLGKLEEAEDQIETVLASDPLNARALRMLASVLYYQRRYEVAVDLALSALDMTPDSAIGWFMLANAYHQLDREEDALKAFRKCEELMPFMRVLKWPSVLTAIAKKRHKWVRPGVLAAVKLLQSSPRAPSAMVADLLIRLGEHERGLVWFERAFRERSLRALYLGVDPAFDAVREHPRGVRLLEELKGAATR